LGTFYFIRTSIVRPQSDVLYTVEPVAVNFAVIIMVADALPHQNETLSFFYTGHWLACENGLIYTDTIMNNIHVHV